MNRMKHHHHHQQRHHYDNYNNSRYNNNNSTRNDRFFEGWRDDGRNLSSLADDADDGSSAADLLVYVDRVRQMMRGDQFESDLERLEFMDGVFRELTKSVDDGHYGDLLRTMNDTKISRVVQDLLDIATERQLRYMCSRFMQGPYDRVLPFLFTGKFASFLMQTMFKNAPFVVEQERASEEQQQEEEAAGERHDDDDEGHAQKLPLMAEMLRQMCASLRGKWAQLAQNQFGSYSIRSLLQTLIKVEMDDEFQSIMAELLQRLQFEQWISSHQASPILVAVLEVLPQSRPMYSTLMHLTLRIEEGADVDAALESREVQETFMHRVTHSTMCRVVETLVKNMDRSTFDSFFTRIFHSRLKKMCHAACGSFVAATIVGRCTHKEQFMAAYNEFVDQEFDSLLQHCKHVVVALINGCTKFAVQQKELIRALLKALGVSGTDANLRRQFLTRLIFRADESGETDQYGCQVAMALFNFQNSNAHVLEECAMSLDTDTLMSMAFDKHGSRVFEQMVAFVSRSKSIRKSLHTKLEGQYPRLAVNIFGSRVLETLLHHFDIQRKQEIANELISNEKKLKTSRFGVIIWNKYKLDQFAKQADTWVTEAERSTKREEMFQDILSAPITASASAEGEQADSSDSKKERRKQKKKQKSRESKEEGKKKENRKRKLQVVESDIFDVASGRASAKKDRPISSSNSDNDSSNNSNSEVRAQDEQEASASLSNVLNLLKSKRGRDGQSRKKRRKTTHSDSDDSSDSE